MPALSVPALDSKSAPAYVTEPAPSAFARVADGFAPLEVPETAGCGSVPDANPESAPSTLSSTQLDLPGDVP